MCANSGSWKAFWTVYCTGNYLGFSSPAGLFWTLELTFSHRNFPVKHIVTQELGFCATALISKERKVNICLQSYFRQLNFKKMKQQEGKSEFRFLQAEDLHGFSNDKYVRSRLDRLCVCHACGRGEPKSPYLL